MLKKIDMPHDRTMAMGMLRRLLAAVAALLMITAASAAPGEEAGRSDPRVTNPGPVSARDPLEDALAKSVDSYIVLSQAIATAAYYNNSEALDIVLFYDGVIEAAAEEYGVEKAMIQAILFQEVRFLNFLDEVDICVQNTFRLTGARETGGRPSPLLTASVVEPVLTGFHIADSSTGLGQIYAKTAIKALNWQSGRALYDYSNLKDRETVWLKLKYDDAYNIHMIGLICRYNAYILRVDENIGAPSVGDILRTYNGTGPSAEKYEEVTYRYFLAFRQYNESVLPDQKL